ncbi:pyocin activator PrtN family protein [Endozoicomonas ascidiicola]|uniref:pyocin activator PrtN family protein n=1 Tax=Endozoicomonas ascidiicola TaxID=1698521 RepID=UPI00083002F4|nr:pyocin activator PrtN family protein [Endozoicomonas ascidiicola]
MESTEKILINKYGDAIIPLESICQDYFGITYKKAREYRNKCKLPIATFKLMDSNKAPFFVDVKELARYIDEKSSDALHDHRKASS